MSVPEDIYGLLVFVRENDILLACQLVNRKSGPTFVCGGCRQGICVREGDIRKQCKVCGREVVVEHTWE
jgi:hypothetical protein